MSSFQFRVQEIEGEIQLFSPHPGAYPQFASITGKINDTVMYGKIKYAAACPIDRRTSLSGSGLPFANASQAFYNTPNQGEIELAKDNVFNIKITIPNSYYAALGTVVVPPTVLIVYNNGLGELRVPIQLSDGVPFRMLTYPNGQFTSARKDATFYQGNEDLPVRTQEQILLDSAYKPAERMPENFWGLRPRC
jgi:hypothetical protein